MIGKKISLFYQTGTYLPRACYSYLNIKNKTLPWHGVSSLRSSEVSLASGRIKGIFFSCFEHIVAHPVLVLKISLLISMLGSVEECSSETPLGSGSWTVLHQEAEKRPGTQREEQRGGKRRMVLWGPCLSLRDNDLPAADLLVAVMALSGSLPCPSKFQAQGLVLVHKVTQARML